MSSLSRARRIPGRTPRTGDPGGLGRRIVQRFPCRREKERRENKKTFKNGKINGGKRRIEGETRARKAHVEQNKTQDRTQV